MDIYDEMRRRRHTVTAIGFSVVMSVAIGLVFWVIHPVLGVVAGIASFKMMQW